MFDIRLDYAPSSRNVPRWGEGAGNPHIARALAAAEGDCRDFLAALPPHFAAFARIPVQAPGPDWTGPTLRNDFITAFDALCLYRVLRDHRPARYLEIGSGNSTRFARRAIEDGALATRITSIDPYPRAEIDRLCDRVIRQPLEDVDLALFAELAPGDVLFVDNSHRCFMNSDVTVTFLDVLPMLPRGVHVHVHDIFLPRDYPLDWAGRWYSEQYLLGAMLANGAFPHRIVAANCWLGERGLLEMMEPFHALRPELAGLQRGGCGFWFVTGR